MASHEEGGGGHSLPCQSSKRYGGKETHRMIYEGPIKPPPLSTLFFLKRPLMIFLLGKKEEVLHFLFAPSPPRRQ